MTTKRNFKLVELDGSMTAATGRRAERIRRSHAKGEDNIAPAGLHWLVFAKNNEGRVCCWAKAASLNAAMAAVDRMWPTHGGSHEGCYPGEERGDNEVALVEAGPVDGLGPDIEK
jgi:hypothetical protein